MTRTLGGVTLITPQSWSENYDVVESTNISEAGTDLVEVTRQDKLTISAQFNCSSTWYHKLYELSQYTSLTLNIYDPKTNANKDRAVRMRDFSAEWQPYSDNIAGTQGYWVVGFSLIEF